MPGRRPKPNNLKILQGTHRPDRSRVRTSDAPFEAGAPSKPSWLDAEAAAQWDELVRELADESGILSPAHFGIVLVACQYFAQYRRAQQFIEKNGETYETVTESGSRMIREYPQIRQRAEALAGYRKCLNDLGATPTQGPRVQRLPDGNQTELPGIARFLNS
ncbi:MAG: hypothetical protein A4E19_05925 [Nitrospira sp. SG-bin1]|nr:MAG: hypothetical protein A4E19_05925 [Nitrospira sp. SG-bin1]